MKIKEKEVLNLYLDKNMNESKSSTWIEIECEPNESVQALSDFLKPQ